MLNYDLFLIFNRRNAQNKQIDCNLQWIPCGWILSVERCCGISFVFFSVNDCARCSYIIIVCSIAWIGKRWFFDQICLLCRFRLVLMSIRVVVWMSFWAFKWRVHSMKPQLSCPNGALSHRRHICVCVWVLLSAFVCAKYSASTQRDERFGNPQKWTEWTTNPNLNERKKMK